MQLSNALGPMLGRCSHLARERLDARLTQYQITPSQTHVLMYLRHHGGQVTQCELTEFLKVKPSTANGILDRMAERELVVRSISGTDARRRLITITEKGAEKLELIRQNVQASESVIVRGFTAQEIEILREMLGRVIRNLEEDRAT